MTSANLELVRSIFADWERGEFSRNDWAHPQIEFVGTEGPMVGTRKGLKAMADAWRDWLSAWKEFRVSAAEYREVDGERVVVLHRFSGRGKTSDVVIDEVAVGAVLFHIRRGKVTRLVLYVDRERALSDAGLAPSAGA